MRRVRRRWAALPLLLASAVASCQAAGPAATRPPLAEQAATGPATATGGTAPPTAEPPTAARAAVDVLVASPARSFTQLPFYVGLAAGLFAEEGLNATMINMASPVAIAAVIDGQVGYTTAGGTTIRAAASGRPVRLIAGGNNRP